MDNLLCMSFKKVYVKTNVVGILIILFLNIRHIKSIDSKANHFSYWEKIVLRNNAKFKTREPINYGSSFLIRLDSTVIACTAREFTGTLYSKNKALKIKDFPSEMLSWEMYLPMQPTINVSVKSIALEDRIESKKFPSFFSCNFLTFSLDSYDKKITALVPNINKIPNNDSVKIVGYDINNRISVVDGTIENWDNSKYATAELRIKTTKYLDCINYIGSPILNKNGEVIGVVNRAFFLNVDSKGRIITNSHNLADTHYQYYVVGTSMLCILGKKYGK